MGVILTGTLESEHLNLHTALAPGEPDSVPGEPGQKQGVRQSGWMGRPPRQRCSPDRRRALEPPAGNNLSPRRRRL